MIKRMNANNDFNPVFERLFSAPRGFGTGFFRRFVKPVTLAISLFAVPAATIAQEEDEERWYQVELVVFAQHSPRGETQEKWRRDIDLSYPANWIELKSPDAVDAPPAADRAAPSLTAFSDAAGTAPEVEIDLSRMPYYFLPVGDHQLGPQARSLKRDSRYRVLFHEAWRQPLVEYNKAPALLIEGGERYGEHRELEGSIVLSVSRYLHLHTNLWLSRFKANYGQEFGDWPELPKKPSLQQRTENLMPEDANAQKQDATAEDLWGGFQSQTNAYDSAYESILASPYIVDRIVTLRQNRKMRSEELHYIDHPLMGLLIKVIPYEPPADSNVKTREQTGTTN